MANVAELAGRLTKKDESALAQIYDLYGGAVYQLALRITRDPGVAEEICLDSFMQLWQQAPTLDRQSDNLLAWLFTIARSRAIDRLRKMSAAKRTPVQAVSAVAVERPDERAEHKQRREIVRKAIAELHTRYDYIADPHTAIGYLGARGRSQAILLATAHPAKFRDVVEPIIGVPVPLPDPLADALARNKSVQRIRPVLSELGKLL